MKDRIIKYAKEEGANIVGIASNEDYTDYLKQVKLRLKETKATQADFMINKDAFTFFQDLSNPNKYLTDLKSIIVIGSYAFDQNSDYKTTRQKLQGKTARTYAYYPVVRRISKQIVEFIKAQGYNAVEGQNIPLKYVSQKIGLGTYGWNGILFTEEYGSYVALRCILTNIELTPDKFEPPTINCDTCGKCIKACPTGALYAPYKVNPKLCINPISRKESSISPEISAKMRNWLCGCDICQEVCPMNKELNPRVPDSLSGFYPQNHASHKILDGLDRTPNLVDIINGNKNITITRNAIIALGNIGGENDADYLKKYQQTNNGTELDIYITNAISRIEKRIEKRRE